VGADELLAPAAGQQALTVEQLTAGAKDPIVVVDFLQLSAAPQLAEVLASRSDGHPVYRIDPVTDLAGDDGYHALDGLAAGYADACVGTGLSDRELMVTGYCSAAALSLLLAARLAKVANVSSVLVQPTWPDARSIAADFGSFRADLSVGDHLRPDGMADADALPDLEASPHLILEQMRGVLRHDLQAMAEARGLHPAGRAVADLLARYLAWLGFGLSSRDALRRPWPGELRPRLLLGATAEPFIPWLDPGSYQVVRLEVPEQELLADAAFADSVLTDQRASDGGAA